MPEPPSSPLETVTANSAFSVCPANLRIDRHFEDDLRRALNAAELASGELHAHEPSESTRVEFNLAFPSANER